MNGSERFRVSMADGRVVNIVFKRSGDLADFRVLFENAFKQPGTSVRLNDGRQGVEWSVGAQIVRLAQVGSDVGIVVIPGTSNHAPVAPPAASVPTLDSGSAERLASFHRYLVEHGWTRLGESPVPVSARENETYTKVLSAAANRCYAVVVVGGDGVEDADVGLYASDRELGIDVDNDRDAVAHQCFSANQEVEVRVRASRGNGPLFMVAYTAEQSGYDRSSWPSWQGVKPAKPSRISTQQKSAESLYRTAARSIFVVASGNTRGSAVAVSERHLLTNCHVLTSDDVLLKRGDTIAVAHLVRADRETDRCILSTDDIVLVPVLGVRPFNRLRVGEAVFAIGAPRGQEGSISSGIISRFDSASSVDAIQVTAAISPGSSGGPLFDSYGNLIGITTYQRTDAQSINFALAADAWWK